MHTQHYNQHVNFPTCHVVSPWRGGGRHGRVARLGGAARRGRWGERRLARQAGRDASQASLASSEVDGAEYRKCALVIAHLASLDPVRIGGEAREEAKGVAAREEARVAAAMAVVAMVVAAMAVATAAAGAVAMVVAAVATAVVGTVV